MLTLQGIQPHQTKVFTSYTEGGSSNAAGVAKRTNDNDDTCSDNLRKY